jgi:hypothetical protein
MVQMQNGHPNVYAYVRAAIVYANVHLLVEVIFIGDAAW